MGTRDVLQVNQRFICDGVGHASSQLRGVALASRGPAPDSGDGVPDGSGFTEPWGNGPGPAPNSGDGIPDGPGW